MRNSSGHKARPLPALRPIFEKWIQLNKRYCQAFDSKEGFCDVPWGYNERASVSTFAAAAWEAGGIALEEYVESKRPKRKLSSSKKYEMGRCDLFISINGIDYIIEAKYCQPILSGNSIEGEVDDLVKDAIEEVRRTWGPPGSRKAGMAIISPIVNVRRGKEQNALILTLVKYLRNRSDCATAWIFPHRAHDFRWKARDRYVYPGTAVLFKPFGRR